VTRLVGRPIRQVKWGVLNIFITSFLLLSCSTSHQQAPVSDRHQPPSNKVRLHVVSAGETLFSIAWRYGLDYKDLAKHNGLALRDTIYPAQRLRLDVDLAVNKVAKSPKRNATHSTIKTARPLIKATPTLSPAPRVKTRGPLSWQWPVKGALLTRFSSSNSLNKGIDIAGKLAQPVNSAGSGTVVYAGSGLRGYGKLLIIKHNDNYLSAYAHNSKLLVKEGEVVKVGQAIAKMGSSGTSRVKLHFEIRREGKPVDPLQYLPKQ